jgi:protein-S-isoprenylcysteine O-methyltransferase Ste14
MVLLGLALAVAGLLLAARSAQLLSGRGRPKRGPQPRFVIAGPYLRVRNPLLGGLVVASAGMAVARGSFEIAVATLLVGVLAHAWVTQVEEPRLRTRFGRAYDAYLDAVPRWIPTRRPVREA